MRVVILIFLSGCTSAYMTRGDLTGNSEETNTWLANNAISQLTEIYPPASTKFNIKQVSTDYFGLALAKGLREQGYAVNEFSTKDNNERNRGISLEYVIDSIKGGEGEERLYHLTLMIGKKVMTRPYLLKNKGMVPAGYWVNKE